MSKEGSPRVLDSPAGDGADPRRSRNRVFGDLCDHPRLGTSARARGGSPREATRGQRGGVNERCHRRSNTRGLICVACVMIGSGSFGVTSQWGLHARENGGGEQNPAGDDPSSAA